MWVGGCLCRWEGGRVGGRVCEWEVCVSGRVSVQVCKWVCGCGM